MHSLAALADIRSYMYCSVNVPHNMIVIAPSNFQNRRHRVKCQVRIHAQLITLGPTPQEKVTTCN